MVKFVMIGILIFLAFCFIVDICLILNLPKDDELLIFDEPEDEE